jgi:hypothetical protein
MKKFGVSAALMLGLAGAVHATDASADDLVATKAAPAATAKPSSQPAISGSQADLRWPSARRLNGGLAARGRVENIKRQSFDFGPP